MSAQRSQTHQHEDFEIKAHRKQILRQDRVSIENGKCFLRWHGTDVEVLNLTAFGIGCLLTQTQQQMLQNSKQTESVQLIYNGIEVQTLTVRIVRSHPHHLSVNNEWLIGLEVIGEPVHVDRIKALEAAASALSRVVQTTERSERIPKDLKFLVYQLKDMLTVLKGHIDDLENKAPVDNARENSEYRETIAEYISHYVGQWIPSVFERVATATQKLDSETKDLCIQFIRSNIGPFVYGAPFAYRAYSKPRGYAGDFEMMNHLYRNEMVGRTLFDQCMHKYFIDEPAGEAVKNRGQYLFEKIRDTVLKNQHKPIKILSIASGPAIEVQMFLQKVSELPKNLNIEFHFIDQDEESLKHAQKEILSIDRFVKSNFKFFFHNLAIKNIIAAGVPDQNFDLIYSAGLFDYFTDPVATMAASKMLHSCSKDGTVVIGNFGRENHCVPFMEMVLDWHLIYRSHDDMKRIFSPVCSKVTVEQEPLGVNLFAVLTR